MPYRESTRWTWTFRMFRKPAFWIALALLSVASAALALQLFPRAFPLVQLEIAMDREAALGAARALAARERLGPPDYRQAASFALDSETQTFVELEGGGKDVFAQMLRTGLYSAYTWRVRHFKEGQKNETLIRFRPDGRVYGFEEKVDETAPGAVLTPTAARAIAERTARETWQIDLTPFALVEPSQAQRPSGRVDHTFVYERSSPTLNEGRYRVRLVVAGDRLTEATHFIKVPEAFTRRYQEMRSANEALGIGSFVVVVLLYVIGGMAIGLFFLLRHGWVIARRPMLWGIFIALLQVLAALNSWPLLWMSYDTALPRATFVSQQMATLGASFVGMSIVFGLTFMAAESLTRRAFGHQPQFWRIWSREAASSKPILGQTLAGYLLVAAFFAYDVLLYFYATRFLGWWTPSEALLHPDVLATYLPWLSAIANSLQAGFWEECLFRAVPIAGAALIGDRFGKRTLFIVIAFIVQSIVFGAGHAPYPTQPSYSRLAELILPSIGFGLIYLTFGLLPGIVLHFAFDVVWFAIPLFVSTTSGIWIDRSMVIMLTLVPLWVVLAARLRTGQWGELPAEMRNEAWKPSVPVSAPDRIAESHPAAAATTPRLVRAWMVVGLAGFVVWLLVASFHTRVGPLNVPRDEAERVARAALAARRVTLDGNWRVMPVPDDGRGNEHRFVWETAGEERFRTLLGTYLRTPRWRVRVATFHGDVADRAEEWTVIVNEAGEAATIAHQLPESRAGASLTEDQARVVAYQTVQDRFRLEPSALREVSAKPAKLDARTDWIFTFQDLTVAPIALGGASGSRPQSDQKTGDTAARGEARIEVEIAGDEVVRTRRFVFVPEQWERDQRAQQTLRSVVAMVSGLLRGGVLLTAAILGIIVWSRRRFAPQVFLATFALLFAVSLVSVANGWPSLVASLSTSQPFQLQILVFVAVGLVALLIPSALVALAAGALPRWMPSGWSSTPAAILGVALGLAGAAISAAGNVIAVSDRPTWPDIHALGNYVPILTAATDGVSSLLFRSVTLMLIFAGVHDVTRAWTTRRLIVAPLVVLVGVALNSAPVEAKLGWWLAAGAITGFAFLFAYVLLLRHDLSLVPVAVGTMIVLEQMREGAQRAFPGALVGALVGSVLVILIAWGMFGLLRRSQITFAAAAVSPLPSDNPPRATYTPAPTRPAQP